MRSQRDSRRSAVIRTVDPRTSSQCVLIWYSHDMAKPAPHTPETEIVYALHAHEMSSLIFPQCPADGVVNAVLARLLDRIMRSVESLVILTQIRGDDAVSDAASIMRTIYDAHI